MNVFFLSLSRDFFLQVSVDLILLGNLGEVDQAPDLHECLEAE